MDKETVVPSNFKIEIPFEFPKQESILISTYFAKENITRKLKFDNHAPTSLRTSTLKDNLAFNKVGKLFVGKPTPDGKTIPNNFFLTDSIVFGNVIFNQILTNEIPDQAVNGENVTRDGLFGKNLIKKGIWKIDFENKKLTFTSSIDSLTDAGNKYILPSKFNETGKITIEALFENNVKETIDVDFGFNGTIILPKKVFDKIDINHKATSKKGTTTSVTGTETTTKYILDSTNLKVGEEKFNLTIRSTDNVSLKLMGLGFFSKFKFVILDYRDKKVYLSK